jgi:hypothetical protein
MCAWKGRAQVTCLTMTGWPSKLVENVVRIGFWIKIE